MWLVEAECYLDAMSALAMSQKAATSSTLF